jgi:hypothetical protein
MDHYEVIAESLTEICVGDFETARVIARISEGHSELRYICKDGERERTVEASSMTGWKVHKALHALQSDMTIPGQEPWSRCTFTLFPDGKFKFDVEYDD